MLFPSGCDKNQIAVEKDFEIDFQVCFSGFIYISAVAGNIASLNRLTRKEEWFVNTQLYQKIILVIHFECNVILLHKYGQHLTFQNHRVMNFCDICVGFFSREEELLQN